MFNWLNNILFCFLRPEVISNFNVEVICPVVEVKVLDLVTFSGFQFKNLEYIYFQSLRQFWLIVPKSYYLVHHYYCKIQHQYWFDLRQ
ncbi:hypothetical protein [Mesomycoplasma ovipneumoniae]|uniref:hypothetical protein n=1 Tax=Mesomycoplasma ovipneumoniae TaxID=29562 RepID=UPI0028B05D85|nr:hypothetical protein [Mesomycoplasma ovipneumoniae]WNM14646.1 hypothetical protein RNM01_02765 [Mesomycoplasma ovipneumoniae]